MAMKMTCPECNTQISGENEQELNKKVRQHAKDHHDMDMSEADARKMIQQQQKS
jgi:predicted small metal-binding protein